VRWTASIDRPARQALGCFGQRREPSTWTNTNLELLNGHHARAHLSSDGLSVTFAPSQPLLSNTPYNVQAQGLRDAAGNLMTQVFHSSFTTGTSVDTTPPQIVLTVPANGAVNVPVNAHYTVQFNKAIDQSSLTSASFFVVDNITGLHLSGTIQVDPNGFTASFVPATLLPIGRSFGVNFTTAIRDPAGNNLPNNLTLSFSTGFGPDTDAPHLLTNSPLNGRAASR